MVSDRPPFEWVGPSPCVDDSVPELRLSSTLQYKVMCLDPVDTMVNLKRFATALVLIPLVCWIILVSPQWSFIGVLAIVGILAFREYNRIVAEQNIAPP